MRIIIRGVIINIIQVRISIKELNDKGVKNKFGTKKLKRNPKNTRPGIIKEPPIMINPEPI
jgi:hypothetical protein